MARRFVALALLGAAAVGACVAATAQQPTQQPAKAPDEHAEPDRREHRAGSATVPAEERDTFVRNLKVWRDLPPAEQEEIRARVRARIQEETASALRDSGLQLDRDGRELFQLRYLQERRKLERELRQKMQAERAQRVPAIVEQLKREFGNASAASPVPAPAKAGPAPSATQKPL